MSNVEQMPTRISPSKEIATQLEEQAEKFRQALPAHIPVERFTRVIATAIQQNPKLLQVERRSLWQSAMKAAQDGLLPDGREAALVIYQKNTKVRNPDTGRDEWHKTEEAQYMPMIAGLRKKVRNSGEIATWDVVAVYKNDEFAFELGDNPFIRHAPTMDDPGELVGVYSIATLKSGEKSRDVMRVAEVQAIRARSRAKDNGPWVTDFAEMAKKTVARRHSKVLPMSTDLDDLIRRDDGLYDMEGASDAVRKAAPARPTLAGQLDALAAPRRQIEAVAHDEDGVIEEESNGIADDRPAEEERQVEPERQDERRGQRSNAREDRTEARDMRGPTRQDAEAERIVDRNGTVVKDRDGETGGQGTAEEKARAQAAPDGKDRQPATVTNDKPPATPASLGKQAAERGEDRVPPKSFAQRGKDAWLAAYDAAVDAMQRDIDENGDGER